MNTAERVVWALWLSVLLAPYVFMLALPLVAIVMASKKRPRQKTIPSQGTEL